MEKYKLINSVTKIETLCDKVTIDGFDYYVSDEEILDTDSYLNLEIKPNGQKNPFWGKIYKKYSITKDEKYEKYILQFCKKVIATNNPNIDVPKVVDEVDRLSFEDIIDYKPFEEVDGYKDYARYGYVKGYKKSQETHPFSKEDTIEFGEWCENLQKDNKEIRRSNPSITTKELLQIWKEQKTKIVYF